MTVLPLAFSSEVADARAEGLPLVALESTIITHGMPSPQNVDTARAVETVVREAGAVPATIAVLDGQLRIGLDGDDLERLASLDNVAKLSRADMAVALAAGGHGATTVSATMIAARAAGIEVFATGGIGGVHRGAETSFDISADLQELAQTPVTVVCAGAKAILDLAKTYEVLETLGVPVIVHGQDSIPAFWSAQSPLPAPLRLDTAAEIAAAFRMRQALGLPGGQLVANPIPAESEIPARDLGPIIAEALEEAYANEIGQKAVTPFLLDRIYQLTKGLSLTANIALVKNNARLGAEIARALT